MIRPRCPLRAACLLGSALALAASGCGSPGAPASAPVLTVVTGNAALAQIAGEVGGSHVRVVDVVPDGADPATAPLDGAAAAQVRAAGLVVLVGGGYQPALAQAATGAPHAIALAPTFGAAPDGPWLDPVTIGRFAPALAAAMTAANPAAGATYRNGAEDVQAEMSSLSADYQDSLSDCPRKVIVTPDLEWSAMSGSYGLVDRPIGASAAPDPGAVRAASVAIRSARATTVFSEPWTPDGVVSAAAAVTHTKVARLETIAGVPAGGWPARTTYTTLMEQDLTVLTDALQCPAMGQN